jgi:hypothetical protein
MTSPSLFRFFCIALIIFFVGFVGWHRYAVHKKYENISRFDYLPKDSIDYGYYDQNVLNTYFANCAKLTDMAKAAWLRGGIDIRTAKTGYGEVQSEINRYNDLLKYTKILEARLAESKDLKDQSLGNDVIEMIQDRGITIGAAENEKDKIAAYDFLKGKNISARSPANEIWEMQKLLNANDYNINITGVFNAATDSALLDFQKANNLYPSHVCDDMTLKKLAE